MNSVIRAVMGHNLKLTFMTSIIFCFIKYVDLIHNCANFHLFSEVFIHPKEDLLRRKHPLKEVNKFSRELWNSKKA